MWKKIHSNRDPRDTLYSEIKKEFSGCFELAGNGARRFLNARAKAVFGLMVVLLAASLILSFTLFRSPEKRAGADLKKVNPVEDGFSQILKATGNIRETIRLKHLVDSLSSKEHLTSADSTRLDSALDRLPGIHRKIKTK